MTQEMMTEVETDVEMEEFKGIILEDVITDVPKKEVHNTRKNYSTSTETISVKTDVADSILDLLDERVSEAKPKVEAVDTPTTKKRKNGYDDVFKEVQGKVDNYKAVIDMREKGETTKLPPHVFVADDVIHRLIAARFNDLGLSGGLNKIIARTMIAKGFDKDDVLDALENNTTSTADAKIIYEIINEVLLDILNSEAGFTLFRTKECLTTLKGEWTKPRICEMKGMNKPASKIDSYLRAAASSSAPKNKKILGDMNENGEFIPR